MAKVWVRRLTILIFLLASIHLNASQKEDEITSEGGQWNDEQSDEVTIPDPQDGSQKLSYKTPKLNEEEQNSPFITDGMKCDSCQAVAVQLHRAFEDGHKHRTNQDWRMSEATIIDKTEQVCTYQNFEKYGISSYQGENRLKGPGIFDEPGLAQMGGKTPFRLAQLCGAFMDLDEMVIYEYWARNGRTSHALKEFLCVESQDYCRSSSRSREEL
ncbi:hypothetical protein TCAL_11750 [Tigriopus californicus]|uniref:DUF3456 domain-containing protein n=1 Tax=Tigriopus californicus TaxID=6832 RepID=A0A553P7I0_TIGCA|nr:marginal zone B- and B1-cell-specific protein-like [Tigriopus californicus]TRY73642.1 hypothetical protein TCAL_11750 [Tigriopus californicus]|eukprot:TCALIF_11750-PA protein Name:"Similar to Mzb1 Marginal zone B- and B1-cell-specific protein (Mus musculus)" AED:0.08 eAED:0.08 QI:241/1/1/1/0.5/0.66/3/217/213